MNLIMQKMASISMLYLTMMHNASTNRQNKGSHHTVYKAPGFVHFLGVCRSPLASLGDGFSSVGTSCGGLASPA